MRMWKNFAGGIALTAMAAAISQTAHAQETTSSVRGQVASAGGPVTNAQVTIIYGPTGQKIETNTNGAGLFDARGLRVGGPYTIAVAAPGETSQTVNDIYLTVGDTMRLDFALSHPDVIVVEGKNEVQVAEADVGTSTTLDRKAIASVVTPRRDLRDLARRDPLVTLDNVTRGTGPAGGIYIAGSAPRLNRITIDGVKSADDFGLNTGGLSTTRGPVSLEAIEQLTVQAVPFDASEGDFTGGAVNVVLRGGSNAFSGSVFAEYLNDGGVGTLIKQVKSPITVHLQNYGGFLSGPILKDRAFFAIASEYYDSLDPNSFSGPADLRFTNLINGPAGQAGPKLVTSDLAGVLASYNTYAVSKAQPYGGFPLVTTNNDSKQSARFDLNITDNQRLQASYRHAQSSLYKVAGSATSISPVSNWYIQGELEDNYSLQLNSRWTDALSTEVRGSYRSYIRHQEPPQGQRFSNISVCMEAVSSGDPFTCSPTNGQATSPANKTPSGEPTFNVGPDQFRQANLLKTKNLSGEFTTTYALGRHLLKGGVQSKNIDIYNLFVQAANGVYYFDSQADFAAGKAGQLFYNNNPSGDPNKAAADFSYAQDAFFLQDSWDVLNNLTLNYGVRYDYYQSHDKPALNSLFQTRYGFTNQQTYDGLNVIMPRFSFKYEPVRHVSVSGGAGLFSGGIPDVFVSNSFSNTGVLNYAINLQRRGDGTFVETTSGAIIDPITAEQLLTINKSTFGTGVPAIANSLLSPSTAAARTATTASLAPNFKAPSDWKGNLAFKWDVFDGWLLGLDVVATQSNTNVAFRDLRARLLTVGGVQQYTPDGRLRYDGLTITGANRAAQGLPVASDPDFVTSVGTGQDIQAYNPSKDNWTRTAALSATKNFSEAGLDFTLAYVHQDAKNFGAISEFGTTPGGFYSDQFSATDPNTSVFGTSTNRIKEQFKFIAGWEHNFVGELTTRVTLFAETRTGRPFSFTMSDASSGRSPVFGVAGRTDQLLYVPNVAAPDATNPLKFTSPANNAATGRPVTVFFDQASTLANFTAVVHQWGLPSNTIVPKNSGENPDVSQVDMQIAQELWTPFAGHKLTFTIDFKNLLNLLNTNWGVVQEYGGSRGSSGDRVIAVSCADPTTGAAINNAAAGCSAYRYSTFNSGPGSVGSNNPNTDTSSRWYIQLGLKYSF